MSSYGQPKTKFVPEGASLTKQSFKDECDIKKILEKHRKTGVWSGITGVYARKPLTGDFTASVDFQNAMNLVADAKQQFAQLPAKVRDRFINDPSRLLDFLNDSSNEEEAIKLGLLPKKAPAGTPAGQTAASAVVPQSAASNTPETGGSATPNT